MTKNSQHKTHIDHSKTPEYLGGFTSEEKRNEDNFDHTDVVWTGADGEVDPDELIAAQGREFRTPLFQVVLALVAGHQPDLLTHELAAKARKACGIIDGIASKGGRPPENDGTLLMEIAYRYHEALYRTDAGPSGTVEIAPIVRAVVKDFGMETARSRYVSPDSLEEKLARDFRENKDLWLARVTTEDPYYSPARFSELKTLEAGLEALARAGVKVDPTKVAATTRPRGSSGDKTHVVK